MPSVNDIDKGRCLMNDLVDITDQWFLEAETLIECFERRNRSMEALHKMLEKYFPEIHQDLLNDLENIWEKSSQKPD